MVYDQDAWAKGLDYDARPLELSRRIFEAMRLFNARYAGLHYHRSASLEFVHSLTGRRTLKDEFDKIAAHTEHHLSQIRLALKNA
jgi:hypothetical protein